MIVNWNLLEATSVLFSSLLVKLVREGDIVVVMFVHGREAPMTLKFREIVIYHRHTHTVASMFMPTHKTSTEIP